MQHTQAHVLCDAPLPSVYITTPAPRPPRWGAAILGLLLAGAMVAGLVLTGCASPPSVVPLLELTRRAVLEEAARLEGDARREGLYLAAARDSVAAAYQADLFEQADRMVAGDSEAGIGGVDAEWVSEATHGYVLAREELLRREVEAGTERAIRAENLRAAAEAQTRAIELLQSQDRLLHRLMGGVDAGRLIAPLTGGPTVPRAVESPTRRDW